MRLFQAIAVAMVCAVAGGAVLSASVTRQTLSGDAIVKALQKGGYVLVMRHASSPRAVPDRQTANPDNTTPERQLDAAGRAAATAMGQAMRALRIPIGAVLSSPTYRALETAKFAGLANARPQDELGEGGQGMADAAASRTAWLQKAVTQQPAGTNRLLITHSPNISGAFPGLTPAVADGEALVFGPDGKGGAVIVARIKIEEWPTMR